MYIGDYLNNRVRKVTAATGVITTVAGTGAQGYGGDGGAATAAQLSHPHHVTVDQAGNLYIADTENNRIRKVTAATGIITTVAGSGTQGYSGDGGTAIAAQLCQPEGVALDGAATLYIADSCNLTIRKIADSSVPAISTHPTNQSVWAATIATFSVAVTGYPPPSLQWQVSTNGGSTWTDLTNTSPSSGVRTATLSIAEAPFALNGHQYRAVAINTAGSAPSNAATLTVNVVAPAVTQQPVSQTVTATQTASFTVAATGTEAPAYQWQVSLPGGGSWAALINTAPYLGATTPTLTVTNVTVGLTGAQYRCVVTNSGGTATSTGATLTVIPPTLTLDKNALQFAATSTGSTFTQQTQGQTVRILQTGAGAVTWTATPSHPWITVSPAAGSGSAALTVGVTFSGGVPVSGAASGTIALAFTGTGTSPGPITVELTVMPIGVTAAPTGVIDTPIDGIAGVIGSLAVTGWAIDDLEVRQVRILRDPVAGEGTAQIFIGSAVFVDGSRPDVAVQFPSAPRSTRAGWGYLLLTNFLPNQGNGTFRLYAYADDADGHTTLLGTRTVTCANATATLPFGAIDTPAQGETISGSNYTNFGWALARGPARADPPSGGTVRVVIDGVFGTSPTGWVSRSDLAALFPAATYPGVTHAAAAAAIDTATLANGLHTIAWVVTTDTGLSEGIGSRYFAVANGSSLQAPDSSPGTARLQPDLTDSRTVNAAPLDGTAISGRRGFDADAPYRTLARDAGGRVLVQGEELDRVDLRLGSSSDPVTHTGYMRVGDGLGPLPIGSHLDPTTGVFTWQPIAGFVHGYDLVFVRCEGSVRSVARGFSPGTCARQEVTIVFNPKGLDRAGPRVVIDTPSAEAGVDQPFLVGGWAIDRDHPVGAGVDAVHVWAYPAAGGDPFFIGPATYGGSRPDVGASFGDRFTNSGYGLIVNALPPGAYDLAVFAWSAVQGGFVPARVVGVTVR